MNEASYCKAKESVEKYGKLKAVNDALYALKAEVKKYRLLEAAEVCADKGTLNKLLGLRHREVDAFVIGLLDAEIANISKEMEAL